MRESKIQMQIIEYLSLSARKNNFIFFSIPNEALLMTCVAFGIPKKILFKILNFFKKMGMLPGTSDIIIIKDGNAFCLEVKSEAGKLSLNQQIFKDKVIECKAKYAKVKSLEEAIIILDKWDIV